MDSKLFCVLLGFTGEEGDHDAEVCALLGDPTRVPKRQRTGELRFDRAVGLRKPGNGTAFARPTNRHRLQYQTRTTPGRIWPAIPLRPATLPRLIFSHCTGVWSPRHEYQGAPSAALWPTAARGVRAAQARCGGSLHERTHPGQQ